MEKLTLKLIEEMAEITRNPTPDGCRRLEELAKSPNNRINVVAVSASLAVADGEEITVDKFMLLLDLKDLN
jgi:hypothetical protein